jgi:hypothetical protein
MQHDKAQIAAPAAVGFAALVAFLAFTVALVTRTRRLRRRARVPGHLQIRGIDDYTA